MTATEKDLRRQLRDALAREAALAMRLEALQKANEGAYREAYDAMGGGGFDKKRPRPVSPVAQYLERMNLRGEGAAPAPPASRCPVDVPDCDGRCVPRPRPAREASDA